MSTENREGGGVELHPHQQSEIELAQCRADLARHREAVVVAMKDLRWAELKCGYDAMPYVVHALGVLKRLEGGKWTQTST